MDKECPLIVLSANFDKYYPTISTEFHKLADQRMIELHRNQGFFFPDGEASVDLPRDISNRDVIIFQSLITNSTAEIHNNIFLLLTMIRAYREYGASQISVFTPYLPYTRQDRRIKGEQRPLTPKLFGDLLSTTGADQVITLDIGSKKRLANLYKPVKLRFISIVEFYLSVIKNLIHRSPILIAPDEGAVPLVKYLANRSNLPWANSQKYRINAETITSSLPESKIVGCNSALIIDDLICSGATIEGACADLIKHGVKSINVAAAHLRLSDKGLHTLDQLAHSGIIDTVYGTDSIPQCDCANYIVVSEFGKFIDWGNLIDSELFQETLLELR